MSLYLQGNRYCKVIRYYALFHKSYDMQPHSHDGCEIMYVTGGECVVTAEGDSHRLREGDFIFLDEYIPHSLYVDSAVGCHMLNLEFLCSSEGGRFTADLEEVKVADIEFMKFIKRADRVICTSDNSALGLAVKDIILEATKHSVDTYMSQLLLKRMLVELPRCVVKQSRGYSYVNTAFKYIQSNYYEDLTVVMIADKVGINKSYLQELFHDQLNCSVMEYVNKVRLDYAKRLLINTDKPVTDIGYDIGFNSRQNFALAFKRAFKVSPMQYRKLYRRNILAKTDDLVDLSDR